MKVILVIFSTILSVPGWLMAQTFSNLNTSGAGVIDFNTSSWNNGFGHRIYNSDPGGKTLLKIAGRHNSSTWMDIMTFTSDRLVGVGLSNPNVRFHVKGSGNIMRLESSDNSTDAVSSLLLNVGNNSRAMIRWHKEGSSSLSGGISFATRGSDGLNERFYINGSGKVGVGTSSPTSFFHVQHSESGYSPSNVGGGLFVENQGSAVDHYIFQTATTGGGRSFSITNSGSVGIGTTTPSEKLEVNGTIRSKEVKVEAETWPDYVFAPDYELRSLEETEAFIQENQHLPEVPSAEEIETEGLALGEMNALLLKKIEELTLHIIEFSKTSQELRANSQSQERKIEELTLKLIEKDKQVNNLGQKFEDQHKLNIEVTQRIERLRSRSK